MTRIPIGYDETNLIAEPAANIDAHAGAPVAERNYFNNYAAYWQARSGFFTPLWETNQASQTPGGKRPAALS